MGQGKPQLKFKRNPYNNFRDNRCHRRTTGWRTTDEFWFHELCWHSQAELKMRIRKESRVKGDPPLFTHGPPPPSVTDQNSQKSIPVHHLAVHMYVWHARQSRKGIGKVFWVCPARCTGQPSLSGVFSGHRDRIRQSHRKSTPLSFSLRRESDTTAVCWRPAGRATGSNVRPSAAKLNLVLVLTSATVNVSYSLPRHHAGNAGQRYLDGVMGTFLRQVSFFMHSIPITSNTFHCNQCKLCCCKLGQ